LRPNTIDLSVFLMELCAFGEGGCRVHGGFIGTGLCWLVLARGTWTCHVAGDVRIHRDSTGTRLLLAVLLPKILFFLLAMRLLMELWLYSPFKKKISVTRIQYRS
jgi:hypothetical protein